MPAKKQAAAELPSPEEKDFLEAYRIAINQIGGGTILDVGSSLKEASCLPEQLRGSDWKTLRLDSNPAVKPDVVADCCCMPEVKSRSVDVLWAAQIIEHIPWHKVPLALREFHRVLKPRGAVFISVPDLEEAFRHVLMAEAKGEDGMEGEFYTSHGGDAISAIDMIYGMRRPIAAGNDYMRHLTGFTQRTLGVKLLQAGFNWSRIWPAKLSLWAISHKYNPFDKKDSHGKGKGKKARKRNDTRRAAR